MRDVVEALRKRGHEDNDEATIKVADDLEAMVLVVDAITGFEGTPQTVTWHNAALILLAETFAEATMSSHPLLAIPTTSHLEKALQMMFIAGYELGEGEYQIKKCHCTDEEKQV